MIIIVLKNKIKTTFQDSEGVKGNWDEDERVGDFDPKIRKKGWIRRIASDK
jgi:hypothetical protein